MFIKKKLYLCTRKRYHGRVARQRSAKPCTAVRLRLVPQGRHHTSWCLFFCIFFSIHCNFFSFFATNKKKSEMKLKEEFVELVTRYKDVIFKVCYIYAEKDDIEDYYQEVLIQIWRSIPKFRGESSVLTWIYKISLNTCISYTRKKPKNIVNQDPILEVHLYENDIEKRLQIDELYFLINRLNKLEKAVILLWLEGRDYEEIASIVGISKANVAVKINRIKEKLKKLSNQ